MKGLYWRPTKVSAKLLVLVAALSVCGLAAVELCRSIDVQPHDQEKLAAARHASRCLPRIKEEKEKRDHRLRAEYDPAETGLIGLPLSEVTSLPGHLSAKQTSINPNFAALVVGMLKEIGVQEGDCVAVGCSGSFPAMNIAVYSAIETLRLRPLMICSTGASQYGANTPDLLWVNMERILYESRLISQRAIAASLGGCEDQAVGMSDHARQLFREAIDRNGLPRIDSSNLTDSINQRMQRYELAARGDPIRAYINVGAGSASVGRAVGKRLYQPGLNIAVSQEALQIDSVMTRFAQRGIPVIHLVEITQLATAHGLPIAPTITPAAGMGSMFASVSYNRVLAALVLLGILAAIRMFVLTPSVARTLGWIGSRRDCAPALRLAAEPSDRELMV